MSTPKPGKAARGTTTGRPIMVLLDILGRRWALRILWELKDDALTFRELRTRCDEMSPSVLNIRLHELADAGILKGERGEGYQLTKHGKDLLLAMAPVHSWSVAWARRQRA
ncbi:MAG: DNA-binding HxlR family transcriptional regulator [Myxococcota bacterium]|jgi:DNA-binding HxlR family transcriptional regulator